MPFDECPSENRSELDLCIDEIKRLQDMNDRYKKALKKLSCLGNGDRLGNSDGNRIAQQALKENNKKENH